MKKIVSVAIIVCLFATVALAKLPQAPPIDPRFDKINKRLDALESAVFGKATAASVSCPCPQGDCICDPATCDCKDCPVHNTKPKSPLKYTGVGREVLFFFASWCANCPAAEQRLGPLLAKCVLVDCSEPNELATKFGITSLPAAALVIDGKLKTFCDDSDVGPLIVGGWLNTKTTNVSNSTAPVIRTQNAPSKRVMRLARSNWSWPGGTASSLVQHMRSQHMSYFLSAGADPSQFSYNDLRTIHDNIHEHRGSGIYEATASSVTGTSRQIYNCSGGNCRYGNYRTVYPNTYQVPIVNWSRGSYCPNCR